MGVRWAGYLLAALCLASLIRPDPCRAQGADAGNKLSYLLEEIQIVGNQRTRTSVIRSFIPLKPGGALDVDDPAVESVRFRLLGTGWFSSVDLRLERGSAPGRVVLVVEVRERNTLVFRKLAAGVGWSVPGADQDAAPNRRAAEPYLGVGVAELNFLGTGSELGGEGLLALNQQGLKLYFSDPSVAASRWSLRGSVLYANAQEYFGGNRDVQVSVDCSKLGEEDRVTCLSEPRVAVVKYRRGGLRLGTGTDVGRFTRVSVGWGADVVRVRPGRMPEAATEVRGRTGEASRAPIDFSIEQGTSFVSLARAGIAFDKRDNTALPSEGSTVNFSGMLAGALLGSDYEFVRLEASFNRWVPMPWKHVVRVGLYGGALFGRAPFFYKFFVSDLTDLQPSRILGMNLDHRPAPNLIGLLQGGKPHDPSRGTAISQMRNEEFALRADVEYFWPIIRNRKRFLTGADLFFLIGAYMLADRKDVVVAVPGYEGAARAPIDLTADVGVRLDTRAGAFRIGFAKIGWLGVTQ